MPKYCVMLWHYGQKTDLFWPKWERLSFYCFFKNKTQLTHNQTLTQHMDITHYLINGVATPVAEATLHVSDLSILRGYGVFDYFQVRRGVPLFWEDYAARFFRSAAQLGLEVPYSVSELRHQVLELTRINGATDAAVRFVLTGGYSPDGYTPTAPNLLLLLHELPARIWEVPPTGLKVITCDYQRDLPGAKSTNYAMGIWMLPKVAAAGADELIYHDGGWVRESPRSNFGIVTREGVLVMPREQVLWGVTRLHILDCARSAGMVVEERDLQLAELWAASEVFLTSTTKGIMAIGQVDDVQFSPAPGPVVQRLQALFLEKVERYLAGN
jgi:branched-chain amino acid aminotransferase